MLSSGQSTLLHREEKAWSQLPLPHLYETVQYSWVEFKSKGMASKGKAYMHIPEAYYILSQLFHDKI